MALLRLLALQLDEVTAMTWIYMGESLLEQRKGRKALECFDQGEKLDPFTPNIAYLKAKAYLQIGDVDEAQRQFRKQLRENPTDIDSLNELGQLLLQLDRSPEAESKFVRVIELDPGVCINIQCSLVGGAKVIEFMSPMILMATNDNFLFPRWI